MSCLTSRDFKFDINKSIDVVFNTEETIEFKFIPIYDTIDFNFCIPVSIYVYAIDSDLDYAIDSTGVRAKAY